MSGPARPRPEDLLSLASGTNTLSPRLYHDAQPSLDPSSVRQAWPVSGPGGGTSPRFVPRPPAAKKRGTSKVRPRLGGGGANAGGVATAAPGGSGSRSGAGTKGSASGSRRAPRTPLGATSGRGVLQARLRRRADAAALEPTAGGGLRADERQEDSSHMLGGGGGGYRSRPQGPHGGAHGLHGMHGGGGGGDGKDGDDLSSVGVEMSFMQMLERDPLFEKEMVYDDSFLYLEPIDRNAYHMRIVQHGDIDPLDYFTLSPAGLTHFTDGGADFTSLEQLEREHFLFSKIQTIPFFRKYRKWKSFTEWAKNVRKRNIRERKNALEENLFFLHPLLCRSLLELRELCYRVTTCKLFHIDPDSTFTLVDFCEKQDLQRLRTTERLIAFQEHVGHLVSSACESALKNFLLEHGFRCAADDEADAAAAAGGMGMGGDSDDDEMHARSFAREITFTERAAMRTQCRKLTKYIRLADFFVVDAFLGFAIGSTEEFLRYVQPHVPPPAIDDGGGIAVDGVVGAAKGAAKGAAAGKGAGAGGKSGDADGGGEDGTAEGAAKAAPARPLFQVEMQFDNGADNGSGQQNGQLTFHPKAIDFKARLDLVVFDGLRVVTQPGRLLEHADFKLYVQPSIDESGPLGEGVNLENMIVDNAEFQIMVDEIKSNLDKAFSDAEEHANIFEPFKEVYVMNETALLGMNLDNYMGEGIDVFRDAIFDYQAQETDFERIPESSDVGIVRIDSSHLKSIFSPSPGRCLDAIFRLVPEIAQGKNDTLLDELTKANDIISSVPYTVDEFVHLTSFLHKTNDQMEALDERCKFVKELFRLVEVEGMHVSEVAKTNNFLLVQTQQALRTSMTLLEDSIDASTQKFSRSLDEDIPKLRLRISEASATLSNPMIESADEDPAQVIEYLEQAKEDVDELVELAERYTRYQQILKVAVATYDDLEEVRADMDMKSDLWQSIQTWDALTKQWQVAPFDTINADDIANEVTQYFKIAARAARNLPGNDAAPKLKEMVEKFRDTLPVVVNLRCESLKQRHWDRIHELVGYEIDGVEGFTLGLLISKSIMLHASEIDTIATEAVQESVLEQMLSKVEAMWKSADFEVCNHKDSKDLFILGPVEDVQVNLEDSLVTISTILGSRYVGPIREQVDAWQGNLMLMQETLDEWIQCQRNWMYLENIFSAQDIQKQLPNESKMFFQVDVSWKEIMRQTNADPNCVKAGTHKGRRDLFLKHNAVLDKIQKSLEDYLETKRAIFARFYFLANDELLEILAQTKDPRAVQPYLRKCFENLVALEFGDEIGSCSILSMFSAEKEQIKLSKNLKARNNVEEWLTNVEDDMRKTLKTLIKGAVTEYDAMPRTEWIMTHAGQVVSSVSKIAWCRDTEAVLLGERGPVATAMPQWLKQNVEQLAGLTDLVRTQLTKLERKIIIALVTTDVHARDIITQMVSEEVSGLSSFTWQQQLRYYWDKEADDCLVKQSNSVMPYGYEYEGANGCLVITPLTDRCWLTISGSLHLKLGAMPAGPAGTGKTESSKDLAKATAVQCIVFNCSEQIDNKMMGTLFRGISSAGCWTCLDEFNRIDIEVLSVIAQQMLVLRQARLAGVDVANFEGRDIPIKTHHVIVTMNPGYAGRTELPDNLKVMFRPVAMMIPNYALIAEIMLFAEGFDSASPLSRKMVKMYKLSSEQLSQQRHYDYGMRAVKSVLVMAGQLKRENPTLTEDVVLIKAMRDSNVPKFLEEDLPLFRAILMDLFPGVVVPYNDTGSLRRAVEEELAMQGLQCVEDFVLKVIQLFETLDVRFGCAIVGPTGGGKTTAYRVLSEAMGALRKAGDPSEKFEEVETIVLNPKCVSMGELYGEFNVFTQEWTDGLASTIMRRFAGSETNEKKWTVFDGPVDALWIENMNTVLDDNMMLCLANGERIKLQVAMRMLFEVQDLEVASPATVSRLGVLYVTTSGLGWRPFVLTWLSKKLGKAPDNVCAAVLEHFDKLVPSALEFVRRACKEPVPTTDLNLVCSLCAIFEALWVKMDVPDMPAEKLPRLASRLFAFSYTWSLGGSIRAEDMDAFDEMSRDLFDEHDIELDCPSNKSLYNFFIDPKKGTFAKWDDQVPVFSYNSEVPYFQMLVPTLDTVRYSSIMESLLSVQKPVFVTGVTGTGKTVVVQNLLSKLRPSVEDGGMGVVPLVVGFSAQTQSMLTQLTIESKLEKKRKNLMGAPMHKKVVVFVDDVNMPEVEEYGAQPPIELLRQFLDHGGFYDREKLLWKNIVDTVLFVAAAPPEGGRNAMTPRFTRHFNVLCLPPASTEVMHLIFGSILNGFLRDFRPEVSGLSRRMVKAAIEVYTRVSVDLLPTPKRPHYTFNLRDVSKVFQGILQIRPRDCQSADVMKRLWIHEVQRTFHDRLINKEDKRWFTELVQELCTRTLDAQWKHEDLFEGDSLLLFADFLKPGSDEPSYLPVQDMDQMTKLLNNFLEDYNMNSANQMNLVFFKDAIEHLCRLARILRQPRGSALLVGVGGSGKQSLTRFACFICEYECFQIELTRGYGQENFHEDLRSLMVRTGVDGKNVAFLVTDSQLPQESFLEDINNILNSGEVPNMFPADEYEKIMGDMRPVVKALGMAESREVCQRQFVERVRDRMHIVLCMSPVGSSFRVRCRNFPSLINCTTTDWYEAWPEPALRSVAQRYLATLEGATDDVKDALCDICVVVHTSLRDASAAFDSALQRKVYTTPKSYLDCLNLYLEMVEEKRTSTGNAMNRLATGVQKLEETNEMVRGLSIELTELQPQLVVMAERATVLSKQLAVDGAEANKVAAKVGAEESIVKSKADATAIVQADAQESLDAALPALSAAEEALGGLSKNDITEMKGFANPPVAVRTVMEAVCILLGADPTWDSAKKVMVDGNFIKNLKGYDRDNISPKILRKILKYTKEPNMQIEVVRNVSTAASSLCMWVHAMYTYSVVAKDVEPKKRQLDKLNAELATANAALAEKQAVLKGVLDKVAELQATSDANTKEKQELAAKSEQTKNRLVRAEKLTVGLADEHVRWKATVEEMKEQRVRLVGDIFLSAACISYYGAFTSSYRHDLMNLWRDGILATVIPCSEGSTLLNVMGDPVQIRDWQLNGLPTDQVSTENAVVVTRARRWPLMIDPQGQANKWIKKMESRSNLNVTKMTDPNLLRSLDTAIRLGQPFLVENIDEELDASIEPILLKQTFKQGSRTLIHLGDSDIDYDPNFRFYLTTKMANPHYMPEVCIKVTIINFTVTSEGLQDQLLGDVVKREAPEVEDKKNTLVMSMAKDKKQLQDIQDKMLQLLSDSTGNILDDERLINTLASSKTTSAIIKERVVESEKTEKEINVLRDGYRPVAVRGSIIYFVVAGMSTVDPMYQYSLEYFSKIFNWCIENSEKSDDLPTRLATLENYITEVIYNNICRGLFEKHKPIFSFLICAQILLDSELITAAEWQLFLRGSGVVDRHVRPPLPGAPGLVSEAGWDLVYVLQESQPAAFAGLCESVATHVDAWQEWSSLPDLYEAPLPTPFGTHLLGERREAQLTIFQRVLLVRCFCEEKTVFACMHFVKEHLGAQFVQSPPVAMVDVYNDTNATTPCVFVLSQGADPTNLLIQFAQSMNYESRLHVISLGQGQGPRAEALIKQARPNGDWVLLQNCHLAKSWMGSLEETVAELGDETTFLDDSFRLYLTSFPADYFPTSVLQNSIKMTNEPPKGLRNNLIRSFDLLLNDELFESSSKPEAWKKLLFSLTFFHGMVQERRKFGPLGWNIRYEFNDSDLETSISVLKMFLEEQESIPWDALQYLTGQINYGGRVTDDLDNRCLMAMLSTFYTPDVLEPGYKFSASGVYGVPEDANDLASYKTYFESLPFSDDPEIFGMHSNANVTFQRQETHMLLSTVLSMQPRAAGSGSGGRSDDDIVTEVALAIGEVLPKNLDRATAGATAFVVNAEGIMDSLSTVLGQELFKFNRLLSVIRKSLVDLNKAIQGLMVMSSDLDKAYISVLYNQVPQMWAAVAYPSLKPLASWNEDLQFRVAFMRKWLTAGRPAAFQLPVFFFPQGFLTGALQNHARKYKVPINALEFAFSMMDDTPDASDITEAPDDGIYVCGLWMEGARWLSDKHLLDDPIPGEMYSSVPPIHFLPTIDYVPNPVEYGCPVYKTSVRAGALSTTGLSTNFVLLVELATNKNPSRWVYQGTAMLCNLND